jgi:hypothetical protein
MLAGKNQIRPDLTAFLPVVVLFVLAVVCVILVGVYAFSPANYIRTVEVAAQDVNGATATNYTPILEDDVDWEALSDSARADIARYAVNAAIEQAKQDGITTFNVMGLIRPQDQPIFLYISENNLYVYAKGEANLIPLKE